ncbi:serine/threonine protein phosphatase [Saccharothrix sp.]|uniref:serine/threonine protein phosphatase n=1 Tax=Saccharothrix sp. TaxID=1873460 RepID=UPI00281135ED|nr:serine/threonine protein phosphatase [Saccharothrix sp.]
MRTARHHHVAATLDTHSDDDLLALLAAGSATAVGVGGGAATVDVAGVPVFAKRVPLTDLELAHPHSTANLFDLPVHCQYGVAGPSFNAWRELAANLAVTEAVLAGETESFAMLHHWRVLPGRPPVADEHADVDRVVDLMGGHSSVRTRLNALATATHSLVLFSEYVPRPVEDWLAEDPVGRATSVERQLIGTAEFLRDRGLLHMDGHLGNMRVAGDTIHLTDFGLATAAHFDLSTAERDFVRRNTDHDVDYAAMRLVNWLVVAVCGVEVTGPPVARNEYVRRCAAGDVPADVPAVVADILIRHSPAAARMNDFLWALFDGDLTAEYPAT